ncbi:hypothetical protein RFI_02711 [Reticulomyxa filosa]|uniref:Uncharacterized protein n=1 Tax=Reticulomyxa filosa TaxID=46433 RepID=X6P7A2_RETFI|nr:hypothetical protein RFI_02711 [Reticulomyxa filosa]|eukprot:ETO34385.1 hypothetical protein RFI_02711 [Reticulomyxa filosa]
MSTDYQSFGRGHLNIAGSSKCVGENEGRSSFVSGEGMAIYQSVYFLKRLNNYLQGKEGPIPYILRLQPHFVQYLEAAQNARMNPNETAPAANGAHGVQTTNQTQTQSQHQRSSEQSKQSKEEATIHNKLTKQQEELREEIKSYQNHIRNNKEHKNNQLRIFNEIAECLDNDFVFVDANGAIVNRLMFLKWLQRSYALHAFCIILTYLTKKQKTKKNECMNK